MYYSLNDMIKRTTCVHDVQMIYDNDWTVFQCYLNEMQDPDNFMPTGIQNKHKVIFGNMEEIYEFHKT